MCSSLRSPPSSEQKHEDEHMSEFDLVIRGGTVVTAADTVAAEVGIRAGRIVSVAAKLEGGTRQIDASGLLVMPGGIDSHVHLAQPARQDAWV
jgi:dihydropyrimidinase